MNQMGRVPVLVGGEVIYEYVHNIGGASILVGKTCVDWPGKASLMRCRVGRDLNEVREQAVRIARVEGMGTQPG